MFFSKKKIIDGNPSRRFPSGFQLRKKIFINSYSLGYYSKIKNFEIIQLDDSYQVQYVERVKFLAFQYDFPRKSVSVQSTHFYYINDKNEYIYSELTGNCFYTNVFRSQKGWLAHLFLSDIENEVIDSINDYLKTDYLYHDDLITEINFINQISQPIRDFINQTSVSAELKKNFDRVNIGDALLSKYELEIVDLLESHERYSGSIF